MKQKGVLIFALVLAIAAVMLIQVYLNSMSPSQHQEMVQVLMAAQDLQPSTRLESSMIKKGEIPKAYFQPEMVSVSEMDVALGNVLQHAVKKDSTLLWLNFQSAESSVPFSTTVEKGSRAITVSVDEVGGVAGHLRKDDRVDVLYTINIPQDMKLGQENIKDDPSAMAARMLGKEGSLELNAITLTLLQNVKILDIGNTFNGTSMAMAARGSIPGGRTVPTSGLEHGYSTVTFLLTPIESELLSFAQEKGRIHLTLRHPEDLVSLPADALPEISIIDIIQPKIREEVRPKAKASAPPTPSGPDIITGKKHR